jgi:hypothetical protein
MDSYKGLIPAVSIYYENLSGKKSGESSMGSRKARLTGVCESLDCLSYEKREFS